MKTALVTGGTGFVGANLVRRLVADGHKVHLLNRAQSRMWRLASLASELQIHTVELHDSGAVQAVINAVDPDWVFHLAAHGAYPAQTDVQEMVRTNVQGTMNLLNASLQFGVEAFVNTGSSSEYGYKDHAPAETEALEPNSDYALTKAAGTMYCRLHGQRLNANVCTLRLYSIYGPYEEPSRLIPNVILRGLRGEYPPLVNPETARDFVYVDDAVEAFLRAATSRDPLNGAVFNISSGQQITLREVAETSQRVLNLTREPQFGTMAARSWDTSCWVGNSEAIQQKLGWQSTHDFESGFRKTVAWFESELEMRALYEAR